MNRRKLLHNLSSLYVSGLAAPWLFPGSIGWCSHRNSPRVQRHSAHERLRFGLVGVAGMGVYFMYPVGRQLGAAYKTIAIETKYFNDRLGWCHAEDSLLIGDGEHPATVMDAQRMGRERKSEIATLVSGLDVVFLLTGLNAASGKGLALAVAETLGEGGVLTIAVVIGRQQAGAVKSLGQIVDAVVEVPFTFQAAPGTQDRLWREHAVEAIAGTCRDITDRLQWASSVRG